MKLPVLLALLLLPVALAASPIDAPTYAVVLAIGDSAGVPRSVTRALMHEESGGDAAAQSRMVNGYRSRGLFQIYERDEAYLARRYWGVDAFDVFDPIENAAVALRYLAALHARFGSWYRALVYYNCGRLVDVPESTRAYARRIVNAR